MPVDPTPKSTSKAGATAFPTRFGSYILDQKLGRGGMAEVFKARVAGLGGFEKVVCIKRVLPHLAEDRQFIQMFIQEAKLSARLTHPNIVQVFDLGEVDGLFYMALEFVRGSDLLDLLRATEAAGESPPPAASAY